jgi:site-specific recombinase XerC
MASIWKRAGAKAYNITFTDEKGSRKTVPGMVGHGDTAKLAAKLEADADRQRRGLADPQAERLAESARKALVVRDAAGKVVGGHLADFLADAAARGVAAPQRQTLSQRVADTLAKAGAERVRDLSPSRIQAAIAAFGEPTADRPEGLSKQSLTHYVRAVGQFSKWLHRERRTTEDLLFGLRSYNAETDPRRQRRGFTPAELAVLLPVTRQAPTRRGMTGPARATTYALAFTSGLRRNELRTLTAASFNLASDPPTVTVTAAYSKHRHIDVQPLPADVARLLAEYLATADPDKPFPLPDTTGRVLAADMADARAATGCTWTFTA